jgi:hypothetical protein
MRTPLKQIAPDGATNGQAPVFNATSGHWEPGTVGSPTVGAFSGMGTAEGASISAGVLHITPATDLLPGAVSTGVQSFAGDKTFTGSVAVVGNITADSVTAANANSFLNLGSGPAQLFHYGTNGVNSYVAISDTALELSIYDDLNGQWGSTFSMSEASTILNASGSVYLHAASAARLSGGVGIQSTDVVVRVGSMVGDASVHADAKLLSVGTNLAATPVEYFGVTKSYTLMQDARFNPKAVSASPVEGMVYYDQTAHVLKFRNASAWVDCGGGGGSFSMGAFGSTPNANGGTASAGVLTLQPADGTHPGGVSTGTQTFVGAKTFSNGVFAGGSGLTATGEVFCSSGGFYTNNAAGAQLYVNLGTVGAGTTCAKVGTTKAAADLLDDTRLLSVQSGLGNVTEVEHFFITKNSASFSGSVTMTGDVYSGSGVFWGGGAAINGVKLYCVPEFGGGATDVCVTAGTARATASVDAGAALLSVRTGVHGTESEHFKVTKTGITAAELTGNAATATKLATARTINGISFDGTADINLPVIGALLSRGNTYICGQNSCGNVGGANNTALRQYFVPFVLARTVSVTQLGGANGAGGSGTAQAGIYGNTTVGGLDHPGTLLASVSLPNMALSGFLSGTVSLTLQAGTIYWASFVSTNIATWLQANANEMTCLLGWAGTNRNIAQTHLYDTLASAVLPGTANTTLTSNIGAACTVAFVY